MPETILPAITSAALHLYQLYDVGDSVDLDFARTLLATPSTRIRPVQSRGASIDIPHLPLEISMGEVDLRLGARDLHGQIHARVFDLGILSFRLALRLPAALAWEEAGDILAEVQNFPPGVVQIFESALKTLRQALDTAVQKPNATVQTEDYALLLVADMAPGIPAAQLGKHPMLLQVALGERRPLSTSAASLATTLSYYEDDLILLTWAAAIVIEPDAQAREDASFLLEFANVQLLAFRSYDAQVENDLARITPRIARQRRPRWPLTSAPTRFLHEVLSLIADTTDANARVENALKVTEDVYWNRVYMAALATLRVNTWRQSIAEALSVLRQTAALLNDEAEITRQNLLEGLVILLILLELIVAVIGLRH